METRRTPKVLPALLLLAACNPGSSAGADIGGEGTGGFDGAATDGERNVEPDDSPVVKAQQPPLPIFGGTLEVLPDGIHAVAADPDRDLIWVVNSETMSQVGVVELESGAQPWRVAADSEGRVHVSLRGAGEVLTFDAETAAVLNRRPVCPNPRGVAERDGTVWVSCLGGALHAVPSDPSIGDASGPFTDLDPDLRDVVVSRGNVLVSSFASAGVEAVAYANYADYVPAGPPVNLVRGSASSVPSVAWRVRPSREGGWLMAHQYGTNASIQLPPPEEEETHGGDDGGGGGDGGYGGGHSNDGIAGDCSAVSAAAITMFRPDGRISTTGPIPGAIYIVDAALSPGGRYIAVAMPGRGLDDRGRSRPSVGLISTSTMQFVSDIEGGHCDAPDMMSDMPDAEVVAVDYLASGRILAQSREPAMILRIDPDEEKPTSWVKLEADSIEDTGHQLFHHDAGEGVACASCHPEGSADGRVWSFDGPGLRRTQPLDAGLVGTEPLHWDGEFEDVSELLDNVHRRRMGGRPQSEERAEAFADWVMSIPVRPGTRDPQDPIALRGATAYAEYGCTSCHRGESTTQRESVELGHDLLQVPSLLGVGSRYPLMHDGRAKTLRDAVVDMFDRTLPNDETHDATTVAEIAAYLETL